MKVITQVSPRYPITITLHPQAQRHHRVPPLTNPREIQTTGIIQSQTNNLTLQQTHVASPRLYKLYIVSTEYDLLSSLQLQTNHITASFVFSSQAVYTQVISCEDCRYNGWVALECTQYNP